MNSTGMLTPFPSAAAYARSHARDLPNQAARLHGARTCPAASSASARPSSARAASGRALPTARSASASTPTTCRAAAARQSQGSSAEASVTNTHCDISNCSRKPLLLNKAIHTLREFLKKHNPESREGRASVEDTPILNTTPRLFA